MKPPPWELDCFFFIFVTATKEYFSPPTIPSHRHRQGIELFSIGLQILSTLLSLTLSVLLVVNPPELNMGLAASVSTLLATFHVAFLFANVIWVFHSAYEWLESRDDDCGSDCLPRWTSDRKFHMAFRAYHFLLKESAVLLFASLCIYSTNSIFALKPWIVIGLSWAQLVCLVMELVLVYHYSTDLVVMVPACFVLFFFVRHSETRNDGIEESEDNGGFSPIRIVNL